MESRIVMQVLKINPCFRIPEGTSHYLKDLLMKLLKKNPKERLTHGKNLKAHVCQLFCHDM